MNVESIATTIFLSILLCFALIAYKLIIHKIINHAGEKLWYASGVLVIISLVFLLSDHLKPLIKNEKDFYYFLVLSQILWWFSLNYLINQIIEFWVWNRLFEKKGIIISRILRDLISVVFIILTIAAIIYFVFDRSVLGIFTASGVMAIILGYSAQATLSDIFAGLGLNTSKEFSVGDRIKLINMGREYSGKVVDISWRFVQILTTDNNYLSLANSVISKLAIENLSSPSLVRAVRLMIPEQGGSSPAEFKKILINAAQQNYKVLKSPKPSARLVLVKENTSEYQLTYYTTEIDEISINDHILSVVWYRCRRENIQKNSTDHSLLENPAIKQVKEFIKKIPLFKILNSEEIKELCSKLIYHHYGPPERVLEQGQSNSSLYLIYQGSVSVYLATDISKPVLVASLESGQYFGEMSLLTGEACAASIFVKEESIILEITHDNIANIFTKRPVLMEKISEIVVLRKTQNEDVKVSQTKGKKVPPSTLINRMLRKVTLFFKRE